MHGATRIQRVGLREVWRRRHVRPDGRQGVGEVQHGCRLCAPGQSLCGGGICISRRVYDTTTFIWRHDLVDGPVALAIFPAAAWRVAGRRRADGVGALESALPEAARLIEQRPHARQPGRVAAGVIKLAEAEGNVGADVVLIEVAGAARRRPQARRGALPRPHGALVARRRRVGQGRGQPIQPVLRDRTGYVRK